MAVVVASKCGGELCDLEPREATYKNPSISTTDQGAGDATDNLALPPPDTKNTHAFGRWHKHIEIGLFHPPRSATHPSLYTLTPLGTLIAPGSCIAA